MDAIFEIMQQLGEFGDVGQMRGQRLPALTIGCKSGHSDCGMGNYSTPHPNPLPGRGGEGIRSLCARSISHVSLQTEML